MKGDEAVLDVSCLSEGVFYAWLSGRAFTPDFGFKTPDGANETKAREMRHANNSVPVNEVFFDIGQEGYS